MILQILGNGGHAKALAASCMREFERIDLTDCGRDYGINKNATLIVGIGNVHRRRAVFTRHFRTHRHWLTRRGNSAIVMEPAAVGAGVDIWTHAYVGPYADIGNNVLINVGACVHHDAVIGDHCVIAPGAQVLGAAVLGEGCVVGAGAIVVEGVELPDETTIPAGSVAVGPHDFRKPISMVRRDGKDHVDLGAPVKPSPKGFTRYRVNPPPDQRPDSDL